MLRKKRYWIRRLEFKKHKETSEDDAQSDSVDPRFCSLLILSDSGNTRCMDSIVMASIAR